MGSLSWNNVMLVGIQARAGIIRIQGNAAFVSTAVYHYPASVGHEYSQLSTLQQNSHSHVPPM